MTAMIAQYAEIAFHVAAAFACAAYLYAWVRGGLKNPQDFS